MNAQDEVVNRIDQRIAILAHRGANKPDYSERNKR